MKADNTCKNVHPRAHDNMNNGIAYFKCSKCDCELDPEPYSDSGVFLDIQVAWCPVSFCPNCGRKVVE